MSITVGDIIVDETPIGAVPDNFESEIEGLVAENDFISYVGDPAKPAPPNPKPAKCITGLFTGLLKVILKSAI